MALAVHLVFQGEVEGDVLYPLLGEGLGARLVLLLLDVLDHVREPHRQAIVAARGVRAWMHCKNWTIPDRQCDGAPIFASGLSLEALQQKKKSRGLKKHSTHRPPYKNKGL